MDEPSRTEPHERLAWARAQAGFETATDAARAFGWNENTYRSHENGERGLKRKVAEVYARAFKTDLAFLLVGTGQRSADHRIPIIGSVGEKGAVSFVGEFETREHEFIADLPVYVDRTMVALEVSQDAYLLAFQPGDLLVVWSKVYLRTLVDCMSLVFLESGDAYMRIIRPGTEKGLYNLEFPSARPSSNVAIESVNLLHMILPGPQWSKMDALTGKEVERIWPKG